MTTSNATINASSQYRTEENKIKDRFSNSIRNRILFHNKSRFISNPIRIFNNKSTLQIKPKNEMGYYKFNHKIQRLFGDKTNKNISYNLKVNIKNIMNDNIEMKDDLIIKLNHTVMDLNKINKEIKDLQNLFAQEQKENLTHKYIINQILQENQNIKVLQDFNSPNNTKINKSFEEENNLENSNIKSNELKVNSVKKVSFSKSFGISSKYSTIPDSIKGTRTRNINKSKIDTLKKELNFYQRMIESREEKLKKFKKKEGSLFYSVIHKMIHNNKKNADLSKIGGEMRDKLISSDEKIFELSQKLYKLKEKNGKSLIRIESYKNKISEMEFEINYLKNERENKQKEELDQENQKSKEESEINSLISQKKELEEKYANKLELKLEEYENKLERDNLFREEKKYKLKNEVYESKLEHCKKKNEELNKKIEEYEKEREDLLEKSKIPRKNKMRIEELEDEVKKLIEEIEGYEKKFNEINKNKNKEEKEKK